MGAEKRRKREQGRKAKLNPAALYSTSFGRSPRFCKTRRLLCLRIFVCLFVCFKKKALVRREMPPNLSVLGGGELVSSTDSRLSPRSHFKIFLPVVSIHKVQQSVCIVNCSVCCGGFFLFLLKSSLLLFFFCHGWSLFSLAPVRITPKPEKDVPISNRRNPSPPAKARRKWKVKIQFNSWSGVSGLLSAAAAAAGLAVRILSPASLAD